MTIILDGYEKAKAQAQANADWTGVPWGIFRDTSGNLQVERTTYNDPLDKWIKIYDPNPHTQSLTRYFEVITCHEDT